MRKLLKKLFNLLPFKWQLWIEILIKKRVDEVKIVHNFFKNRLNGVMIDVGAHYGSSLENFMKDGWVIHAFEPDPNNREKLIEAIGSRKNVKLNTEAVNNESGLELAFYSSEVSSGISGLSNFHPSHKEITKVTTITLKDYINNNQIDKIDFLKIDTEGHDLFVLEGFDWINHSHPDVIICEFEDKKTIPLGYTTEKMVNFLKAHDYEVLISEWKPIVEYGLAHEFNKFTRDIDKVSKNSWGNLIASKRNIKLL